MSQIFTLSLNLLAIYFAFWIIRPINFARLMPFTPVQARFLKVILAIIMGYLLASFFISAAGWVIDMPAAVFKK